MPENHYREAYLTNPCMSQIPYVYKTSTQHLISSTGIYKYENFNWKSLDLVLINMC